MSARLWCKIRHKLNQLAKGLYNHTPCLCEAIGTFLGAPYACMRAQYSWASHGGMASCYRDTFHIYYNISKMDFQINNAKIVTRKSERSHGCENYDVLRYRLLIYVWKKEVCYIGKIKYPLGFQSATESHREKNYFVRNVQVFKLLGVFTLSGVFHVWFLTSYLLFLSQICQTSKSKSDKSLHIYVRIKIVKPSSFHGQDKSLVSSSKASCFGATIPGLWSLQTSIIWVYCKTVSLFNS